MKGTLFLVLILVGCLLYVGWVSDDGYRANGDLIRVVR